MKLPNVTTYAAAGARTVMVLGVLLTALLILEVTIVQLVMVFGPRSDAPVAPDETRLTKAQRKQRRINRSRKEFLPDGTVHLIHTNKARGGLSDERTVLKIYDAQDKLLWSGHPKDQPYEYITWAEQLDPYGWSQVARLVDEMQWTGAVFSRAMIVPVVGSVSAIVERWRYDPSAGRFVGYDSKGRTIGYAGAGGVVAEEEEVQPFGPLVGMTAWTPPDSASPVLLLQTEHRVYQVSFEARSVEVLFDLPGRRITRVWMTPPWRGGGKPTDRPCIFAVTEDRTWSVLLARPTERLTVVAPGGASRDSVTFAATKGGTFLKRRGNDRGPFQAFPGDRRQQQQWLEKWQTTPFKQWVQCRQIDAQGNWKLIGSYEWTYHPRRTETRRDRRGEAALKAKEYVTLLSPPVSDLAWRWYWRYRYRGGLVGPRPRMTVRETALVRATYELKPAHVLWSWVLAALMLLGALWHALPRRVSWIGLVGWMALIGLFGPAGLL
ncbi:hypothetical protein LCGC14_1994280, partial [marine sediment metagenome]